MTLLCMIDKLVKQGSQFIIASHSPILISYYNGQILDLNRNLKEVKYENTDIYKTYMMLLKDAERMQKYLCEDE